MRRMNLRESINYLNDECGYIDVENDADYTEKEIIEIANSKKMEEKKWKKKKA